MKSALDLEESPLHTTVESVLPGVLDLHRSTEAKLNTVLDKVEAVDGRVNGLSESIEGILLNLEITIKKGSMQTRQELGKTFLNIASSLLGRPACINDSQPGYSDDESNKLPALGNESIPALLQHSHPHASSTNGAVSLHANVTPANEDFHETVFQLTKKHKSIMDIYDEWYGTGDFFDSLGGVNGRNQKYKSSWRKHIHPKTYSRNKQCMKAVEGYARQNKLEERDAANELQPMFAACNCSITGFVNRCFVLGYLEKKKSRGKTVQREESN